MKIGTLEKQVYSCFKAHEKRVPIKLTSTDIAKYCGFMHHNARDYISGSMAALRGKGLLNVTSNNRGYYVETINPLPDDVEIVDKAYVTVKSDYVPSPMASKVWDYLRRQKLPYAFKSKVVASYLGMVPGTFTDSLRKLRDSEVIDYSCKKGSKSIISVTHVEEPLPLKAKENIRYGRQLEWRDTILEHLKTVPLPYCFKGKELCEKFRVSPSVLSAALSSLRDEGKIKFISQPTGRGGYSISEVEGRTGDVDEVSISGNATIVEKLESMTNDIATVISLIKSEEKLRETMQAIIELAQESL